MSRALQCSCLLLIVAQCQIAGSEERRAVSRETERAPAAENERSLIVAVVDMDRAAKELGLSQKLIDILKEREEQLRSLLTDLEKKLKGQMEARTKRAGDNPSQKDREELNTLGLQLGQVFNNARTQGQAQLQGIRGNLIHQIRTTFKQKIASIAQVRRIHLVLEASNDPAVSTVVLYNSPATDITNDLIEALKGEVSKIKLDAPSFPTTSPELNFGDKADNGAVLDGTAPRAPAPNKPNFPKAGETKPDRPAPPPKAPAKFPAGK